ncbi:MAG: hypothetical protein H6696_18205 [Deferribacteres bacterium]|nr:hypothetical protein [Deferribacteres bacterium]
MEKVKILIEGFKAKEFARELEIGNDQVRMFSEISINRPDRYGFTISPETGAVIVAGLSSLTLLINSILTFLTNRKNGTVRIVSSTGKTIEFHRDATPKDIEMYLEIAKGMEIEHIVVTKEHKKRPTSHH